MSSTINKTKYFLLLLLDSKTSKEQAKALLETVTPDQVNAITEIIHNLLLGQLPLSSKVKEILKKRRTILTKLSDKTRSVRTRGCLIINHNRLILDTLIITKSILLKVIKG